MNSSNTNTGEVPTLDNLQKHLKKSRSASDFYGSLQEIAKDLGITNYFDHTSIKALLIDVIEKNYGDSLKTDILLNALGLMVGFDNNMSDHEIMKGRDLITARRELFIKISSYVEDNYGSKNTNRTIHYESYDELQSQGESAVKAVIKDLGAKDGELLDELGKKLWTLKSGISTALERAKEKHIENDVLKLPQLRHRGRAIIIDELLDYCSIEDAESFNNESVMVWKQLGLQSNPGLISFKNFLGNLILEIYDEKEMSKTVALKRDLSLLRFNLLDGYHCANAHGDLQAFLKSHFDNYLSHSDYCVLAHPNRINEEIGREDAVERLDLLDTVLPMADTYKKEIIQSIFHIVMNEELQQRISRDDTEQDITLYPPCYTCVNYSSYENLVDNCADSEELHSDITAKRTQGDNVKPPIGYIKKKERKHDKRTILITICAGCFVGILILLFLYTSQQSSLKIPELPPGYEVESTEHVSFNPSTGIFEKDTKTTVRNLGDPNSPNIDTSTEEATKWLPMPED